MKSENDDHNHGKSKMYHSYYNVIDYNVMFSTPPLMTALYPHEDFDDIVNYIKGLQYRTNIRRCQDNEKSVDTFVLKKDILGNLHEFIKGCVKEYTDKIFVSDQELRVTQSWVNRNKLGQEHHYHYHPNSVLSGVFFLQSSAGDKAPIKFLNDQKVMFDLALKKGVKDPYNEYINSSYICPSQPRTLCIFPSYIPHCVPVNVGVDRYSLSFNTFPSDSFGSKTGLTYVDLEKEV